MSGGDILRIEEELGGGLGGDKTGVQESERQRQAGSLSLFFPSPP